MARPLKYHPEPTPIGTSAEEELHALLETLHRTGTLQLIHALIGQLSNVARITVDRLSTDSGQRVTGNLGNAISALATLPPDRLEAILEGVIQAVERTRQMPREDPPSLFRLAARARDEDARRGMAALVELLRSVGRALGDEPRR